MTRGTVSADHPFEHFEASTVVFTVHLRTQSGVRCSYVEPADPHAEYGLSVSINKLGGSAYQSPDPKLA